MSKSKNSPHRGPPKSGGEPKSTADDVVSLIAERTRLLDWMAALDAKREQTPPQVFTRVRGDYEARLKAVGERLAAHTGSLAAELAQLTHKMEEIDERTRHQEDERAEIELRAQVGELDDDAVTEAREIADDALDALSAERSEVEANFARVTDFFAAAGGKSAPSAPVAPTPRAVAPPPTPGRPSRTSFDELSFLQSVVGAAERPAAPPPVARPSTIIKPAEASPRVSAERKPDTPVEAKSDPVAAKAPEPVVESKPVPVVEANAELVAEKKPEPVVVETKSEVVIERKPEPVVEQRPEPVIEKKQEPVVERELAIEREVASLEPQPTKKPARQTIAMQQSSMTIELSDVEDGAGKVEPAKGSLLDGLLSDRPSERPFAANVASNSPLSLRSSGKSDSKTLKCKECSALNDPTEWYCERCGAELSGV